MTSTANDWFTPTITQDSDILQQFSYLPGLKELLTVRQVHALEHATVWILSEQAQNNPNYAEYERLGGMSTEQGFYIYGPVETNDLRRAVQIALGRIQSEWDLAIHPRCGTNLSVTMLVTAGLVTGASLLLPKDPLSQLLGAGIATTTAFSLAPQVGIYAQRYVTTAIPFNLEFVEIEQSDDFWGRPTHFVRLNWRDLQ